MGWAPETLDCDDRAPLESPAFADEETDAGWRISAILEEAAPRKSSW